MNLDDLAATHRAVWTVPEAGSLFALGRTQAYEAAQRGDLPVIRIAGRLHVPIPQLRALIGLSPPSLHENGPAPVNAAPLEVIPVAAAKPRETPRGA